ncbi:MAG: hypothetical protein BGO70_08250 [Bacteroidetes bacterium 43-93]|nr:hypothetical protein [Bacteroidota bacterium]OJW97757.1 MAG: hypothetical protein BGO70_08250 [Bacteroidetes bacterium 43-93]
MKKIYIIGLMACTMAACKTNIEPSKPDKGSADFTRYVAVGNSLTAGFADGSLYKSGQENSYPSILAGQFKLVGGGNFKQPLLPGNFGYPGAKLTLQMVQGACDATSSLAPAYFKGALDTAGSAMSVAQDGPYNNMGVPGIRCIDFLFRGYGMLNPYARRFYVDPAGSRPADEAGVLHPTFFTMWIGANDVLGYATAGGDGSSDPTAKISDPNLFAVAYDTTLSIMRRNGAQGVLINIPDVTAIPFFTTIPANGLTLTQDDAYRLNDAYNNVPGIRFQAGANYFLIADASAPAKFRHIQPGEYILLSLPMDSVKCAGWGTKKPIPANYVLTAGEVANIQTATSAYNQIISRLAQRENLAVVDLNSYLRTLQSGILFNGVAFNTTFVSGGAFSLDGVHLTPRGYALVANQIINTINNRYNATIPQVDVNKYNGVLFP